MKNFHTNKSLRWAILCLAITAACSADGQEAPLLDAVQVTANRNPTSIDKTLASVSIIVRADIEQSQAPDLAELLSQQTGLDVVRSGGSGSNVSIFTRGSNSNHTLILINGVRVNTAVQGSFDISHLPLAMIERIEIVRGPRAAFWGSDAIGGVIQIFTREAGQFVELRAGSYGRAEVDAGFFVGDTENNFGISLGYGRAGGFSATNANEPFGSFNADNDGFENRHLLLQAKTDIESYKLNVFASATNADIEFDQGESSTENRELGLNLQGDFTENWQHTVTLGHAREALETPVFTSVFGSRRTTLDWLHNIKAGEQHRFNIGLNASRESGFSDDGFARFDQDRRNTGLFAAWQAEFTRNQWELSVRYDDNNQFGNKTTGQAAWGFKLSDEIKLRASWGQGFRAPNFNELYYPGFFGLFAGNPNLQPESSESAELGLNFKLNNQQQLEVSAYHTRVEDLIAFEGANFSATNIKNARLKGLEAEYQFNSDAFSLKANAAWQDARDLDNDTKLLRRADRKLNINSHFKINEQWSWGLDLQAASKRPDFDNFATPGPDDTGGYGRLDARLSYAFGKDWSLEARLENLGDKSYELIRGYNTAGRSGLLTLRWSR